MAVFLDEDGLIPSLEKVPSPSVQPVKELGVNAVQLTHAYRKIAVRGLDEKMVMIVHKAISMTDPVVSFIDVLKSVEKIDSVLVGLEDGLLFISPGGDVIDGTRIFYTKRARHNKSSISVK